MTTPSSRQQDAGPARWRGDLSIPDGAHALVVILPRAGTGATDELSEGIARACRERGIATFRLPGLFDPLEARRPAHQGRTGQRIAEVLDWAVSHGPTRHLSLGVSAAGAGVAAAVVAAAVRSEQVAGLVFHAGRPDQVLGRLSALQAATLLLVGSEDRQLIEVNRVAYRQLRCVRRFEILPGLSRTLEGPGAVDSVSALSASWFEAHLRGGHGSP